MMKAVRDYLTLRRSLGWRLLGVESILRRFAHHARDCGERHVQARTAIEWARKAPSARERWNFLQTIIRFAQHVHAEDRRHEIPPGDVFPHRQVRRIPHIFSPDEIRRLMAEAGRLGPTNSLRPVTFRTLFGLLAVTGLRISEAQNLLIEDIQADGLVIRQSKFKKTRLVPLHRTTTRALDDYLAARRRFPSADRHVFLSLRGRRLSNHAVYHAFRRLLMSADIRPDRGRQGPFIHDLRHTFCVRALLNCPEGRASVAQHMLAVSTYMGHSAVHSTYWYMEAVPDLMTDIARACERHATGGFP